jgi:acyl-coenzyme A synthetase/AMP-(fatty) acid ligase
MPYWEQARRTLSLAGLERFNFAEDVIGKWATDPARVAIHYVDREGDESRWTFRQLAEASGRLANVLRERGLRRHEPILLQMDPRPGWWIAALAVLKAGGVILVGRTDFQPQDVAQCVERAGARLAIVGAGYASRLPGHVDALVDESPELNRALAGVTADCPSPRTRSADPALLRYTSGTTGAPKLVLHSQASAFLFRGTARRYAPGDLDWQPIAEAGQSLWAGPWCEGAAILVADGERLGASPRSRLETLARQPVTHFLTVPAMYQLLLGEDPAAYAFPRLRSCVSVGSPLAPRVISAWKAATGLTIHQSYSQSEMGTDAVFLGEASGVVPQPPALGKPDPRLGIAILDGDRRPVPPGVVGDIACRLRPRLPAPLFLGYWRDPAATAACFGGDWYLTGDLGVMDQEGYVTFSARADDVMKVFGLRVGPLEVESALAEHPAVREAAVIGVPHRLLGESIKAFVVVADGAAASPALAQALRAHVEALRGPYRCPQAIEFLAALPKTERGKLRRAALRECERQQPQIQAPVAV